MHHHGSVDCLRQTLFSFPSVTVVNKSLFISHLHFTQLYTDTILKENVANLENVIWEEQVIGF